MAAADLFCFHGGGGGGPSSASMASLGGESSGLGFIGERRRERLVVASYA
jgi:hypothetical protein